MLAPVNRRLPCACKVRAIDGRLEQRASRLNSSVLTSRLVGLDAMQRAIFAWAD
jgi:hypothetical protein